MERKTDCAENIGFLPRSVQELDLIQSELRAFRLESCGNVPDLRSVPVAADFGRGMIGSATARDRLPAERKPSTPGNWATGAFG